MSDLPEGWGQVKLIEVAQRITKGSTPTSYGYEYQDKGIAFVKVENVKNGLIEHQSIKHFISEKANLNQKRSILEAGDILFSIAGTIGETCLVRDEDIPANTNQALAIIRGTSDVFHPKFLRYQLESEVARKQSQERERGGGMNNISLADVGNLAVAVPPTNEQYRIVAKLEMLLRLVGAAQTRLETIPLILKRFRQSVLEAACSGRLTADWRNRNGTEELDDLPSGWRRITVEELLPKNGIFDGPFGSNLKTSDYTPSGVRVIRLENIGHLKFIGEKETYVSEGKYKTLIRHAVEKGDIIFASFIADEIRACVLPQLNTKAIAKADCFCLRPKSDFIDRTYLTYQLGSQETFNFLIRNIHGATRPRINTSQLKRLLVRICPLSEQEEIVRRVKALLKTADTLEARYLKAKAHIDKLRQSILAKALRGELVPQDPSDEPAQAMLERVRKRTKSEKGNSLPPRKSRRKSTVVLNEGD